MPQGSGSGANTFTCYSTLIDKVVPEDIMINGLPDNHLLRKSFNAYDTKEEKCTKEKLEATIATIKSWMDKMRLKLNADKTEYIVCSKDILKNRTNNFSVETSFCQFSNMASSGLKKMFILQYYIQKNVYQNTHLHDICVSEYTFLYI